MEVVGLKINMSLEQNRILEHIDDPTSSILIAQAPAGTGQTFILPLSVAELLEKCETVILVTVLTNLAVQELAEKILNYVTL